MKFWKEVLNTTLHILLGGILCYAIFPAGELWMLMLFTGAVGGVREYIQFLRGHKQIWWMKFLDTGGFIVGSILYVLIRSWWKLPYDRRFFQ